MILIMVLVYKFYANVFVWRLKVPNLMSHSVAEWSKFRMRDRVCESEIDIMSFFCFAASLQGGSKV